MQEAPRAGSSVALVSDRRLWLTAPLSDDAAEVVEEGDPRAAILLVGEGGEVTLDVARRFNLSARRSAEPTAADRPTAAPETAETGPKAPEDAPTLPVPDEGEKARQPAEDKALRVPRPARSER